MFNKSAPVQRFPLITGLAAQANTRTVLCTSAWSTHLWYWTPTPTAPPTAQARIWGTATEAAAVTHPRLLRAPSRAAVRLHLFVDTSQPLVTVGAMPSARAVETAAPTFNSGAPTTRNQLKPLRLPPTRRLPTPKLETAFRMEANALAVVEAAAPLPWVLKRATVMQIAIRTTTAAAVCAERLTHLFSSILFHS